MPDSVPGVLLCSRESSSRELSISYEAGHGQSPDGPGRIPRSVLGKEIKMRVSCSIEQPVSVTDYIRVRFGKLEYVRAHCRSLPNR